MRFILLEMAFLSFTIAHLSSSLLLKYSFLIFSAFFISFNGVF